MVFFSEILRMILIFFSFFYLDEKVLIYIEHEI